MAHTERRPLRACGLLNRLQKRCRSPAEVLPAQEYFEH
jgi:hypothetical protein